MFRNSWTGDIWIGAACSFLELVWVVEMLLLSEKNNYHQEYNREELPVAMRFMR